MNELKNKVAIITGAASGIGRATAIAAARAGALLFLTDINLAPLEAVRYLSCLYLPYLAFALVSEAKVGAK